MKTNFLAESMEFLDKKFKISLRELRDMKSASKAILRKNLYLCLTLIFTFILLRVSIINIFPEYYNNFSVFFRDLDESYSIWHDKKASIIKFFLPQARFFSQSLSFFKVILISVFASIFYCVKPIFDNKLSEKNFFINFFQFYDEKSKDILFQELLYSEVINNNVILLNKKKLILEDNTIFNFEGQFVDVAQIKAVKKNMLQPNKSFTKNYIDYRGFIISTKIEKNENRSLKIFIGDLKNLNLEILSYYPFKTPANDKIQIFAFSEEDLNFWNHQRELSDFFENIREYIYSKKYYYDQKIINFFDGFLEDSIEIKNFLEITIDEENLTLITSTGRRLLKSLSIFDQDSGINDCLFIVNIIEIFRELIKKVKTTN